MKDETVVWFTYADENLRSAKILLEQILKKAWGHYERFVIPECFYREISW